MPAGWANPNRSTRKVTVLKPTCSSWHALRHARADSPETNGKARSRQENQRKVDLLRADETAVFLSAKSGNETKTRFPLLGNDDGNVGDTWVATCKVFFVVIKLRKKSRYSDQVVLKCYKFLNCTLICSCFILSNRLWRYKLQICTLIFCTRYKWRCKKISYQFT